MIRVSILFLVVGLMACASPDTTPKVPDVTDELARFERIQENLGEAPTFSLETLEGQTVSLKEMKGQVVMVNFWATWCTPCIEEIPALVQLQKDLAPYGFRIVGISLDEEGPEAVAPFVQRFSINYPIAIDDGSLADAFGGVYVLPTTYLIDGEGNILKRIIGVVPLEELRPEIAALVKAPA